MFKFIIRKLAIALTTLWVIASATFFLMHAIPGDPFASEKKVPPLVKAKLMEKYQLDKPLIVQYGNYLGNVFLKGDLGISMKIRGRSVNKMIINNFPKSFILGVFAMIVALAVGLPLGIYAALNRGKFKDSLSIQFYDIDIEEEYKSSSDWKFVPINNEEAKIILDFILKHKNDNFLIHCEKGQSRSAGVGLAIECILKFNGNKKEFALEQSIILNHHRYEPNMLVYDKILEEYKKLN